MSDDDLHFDAIHDRVFDAVMKAVEGVCTDLGAYSGDAVAIGMAMAVSSFLVGMGREFEPQVEELAVKLGPLILADFREYAVFNTDLGGQA